MPGLPTEAQTGATYKIYLGFFRILPNKAIGGSRRPQQKESGGDLLDNQRLKEKWQRMLEKLSDVSETSLVMRDF